MDSYNLLFEIIKSIVDDERNTLNFPKIAIVPFGKNGVLTKQILNVQFGIQETYIADNMLYKCNSSILSVDEMLNKDLDEVIILINAFNKTVNQQLVEQIRKRRPDAKIINILDLREPCVVDAGGNYEKTEEHENVLVMMGETLLSAKMMMWDSTNFPFIPSNWDEYGFKVFSQNNEDGLLQYIIHHTIISKRSFIEFGVQDYWESNTRFLLLHNSWSGLIMDSSCEWMQALRKQNLYWKRRIKAKGVFITKENINDIILQQGFSGEAGVLSVDIDGNDYWVLDAIDCVDPKIIICEFNPIFGPIEKVSIPYKADFYRTDAHYSNLYWGASLGAFSYLTGKRGYKLVCINNLGNNAFFVKEDACDIPEISIEDAWKDAVFRESRDEKGNLTFLSWDDGRKLIEELPVIDVVTGKEKQIKDIVL